jgi:tRNA threonylcarbamoyladenosine biosynthesis protein TsaB
MKFLAIETSTASSSIALGDDESIVAAAERVDRRGHVSFLVPALEFCFAQAGWKPAEVEVVAVDVGPGLFSGIRAGLATAQAVAGAVGAQVVPVSSVDAVALRAATGHRKIWSVIDTRRGEFAVGSYRPVPGGVVRERTSELCTPAQLRALLEEDAAEALVVGDWSALPEGTLRGLHAVKTGRPRFPDAAAVLQIARGLVQRGDLPHPDEVRPLYMREPDVTINWTDFRSEGPWQ